MCLGIDLWVYPGWSLFSFLHLQVYGGVCAKFGEFLVMNVFPACSLCLHLCWGRFSIALWTVSVRLAVEHLLLAPWSWRDHREPILQILLTGPCFTDLCSHWKLASFVWQHPSACMEREAQLTVTGWRWLSGESACCSILSSHVKICVRYYVFMYVMMRFELEADQSLGAYWSASLA